MAVSVGPEGVGHLPRGPSASLAQRGGVSPWPRVQPSRFMSKALWLEKIKCPLQAHSFLGASQDGPSSRSLVLGPNHADRAWPVLVREGGVVLLTPPPRVASEGHCRCQSWVWPLPHCDSVQSYLPILKVSLPISKMGIITIGPVCGAVW